MQTLPKVHNHMWLLGVKDGKWHWMNQLDSLEWGFISNEQMEEIRNQEREKWEKICARIYNDAFDRGLNAKGTIQD